MAMATTRRHFGPARRTSIDDSIARPRMRGDRAQKHLVGDVERIDVFLVPDDMDIPCTAKGAGASATFVTAASARPQRRCLRSTELPRISRLQACNEGTNLPTMHSRKIRKSVRHT
jgi:hypothetical protein